MVRLMTGLDRPDSGEVRFSGEPAPDISARAQWRSKVACVYQKSTIIPDLTVGENLFLNDQPGSRLARSIGGAPAVRTRGARRLGPRCRHRRSSPASSPSANGSGSRSPGRSGGAAASSSSTSRPRGSNRARSGSSSTTSDRLKAAGVTFLFISHHLQEIYEICERVAVMRDGRLVAEAAVGDLDQDALVAAMVGAGPCRREAQTGRAAIPMPARRRRPADRARSSSTSIPSRSAGRCARRLDPGARRRTRRACRAGGLRQVGAGAGDRRTAGADGRADRRSTACRSRPGRAIWRARFGVALRAGGSARQRLLRQPLRRGEHRAAGARPARAGVGLHLRGRRRELAEAMISRLEIKVSDATQNTSELSGGNQQKTVMGRALASEPKVLVLGHPTAGVDIASKEALFGIIRATRCGGAARLRRDRRARDLRPCAGDVRRPDRPGVHAAPGRNRRWSPLWKDWANNRGRGKDRQSRRRRPASARAGASATSSRCSSSLSWR